MATFSVCTPTVSLPTKSWRTVFPTDSSMEVWSRNSRETAESQFSWPFQVALPWFSWVTFLTARHLADQDFIDVFWSLRTALTSPRVEALNMRFCNLNTFLSSLCQGMWFHSIIGIVCRALDLFITTCTYSFQFIVSLSAYPGHYPRRSLLTQSCLFVACG